MVVQLHQNKNQNLFALNKTKTGNPQHDAATAVPAWCRSSEKRPIGFRSELWLGHSQVSKIPQNDAALTPQKNI